MQYSDLNLKTPVSDTPPDLADEMVKMANITKDHLILEPGVGKGNILNSILKKANPKNIFLCESNKENRIHIKKTFNLEVNHHDFLTLKDKSFDRILMNPPYKHTISHILKAYQLLDQNGKLIALIHPQVFKDKKFSDWILFEADSGLLPVDKYKYFDGQSNINPVLLSIYKYDEKQCSTRKTEVPVFPN